MSLKGLSTAQMLELSEQWMALPERFEASERLSKAHEILAQAQTSQMARAVEAQEQTLQMSGLDDVHDRLARGLHHALSAVIELSGDEGQALIAVGLRQKLYPQGLRVTQLSYEEQAQVIDRVEESLEEQEVRWLSQVSIGGHTLWSLAQRWFEAGRVLRQQWVKRHESVAQADMLILRARTAWLSCVEQVQAQLERSELEDEALERWRAPLFEAQQKAAKRVRVQPER